MKSVIPWILAVAMLGGVYFLYSAGQTKEAELVKLRQENQNLEQVRSENEELKKVAAQSDELVRLRKDNEDLLRLRSEVSKLREQNKQLGGQLQAAESQRSQQLSQLAVENESLRTQQAQQVQQAQALQQAQQAQSQSQAAACINILRQIDGAKQSWALENKKPASAVPTPAELAPYLPNGVFPGACPVGGAYSPNAVGALPTCSIPGHALK